MQFKNKMKLIYQGKYLLLILLFSLTGKIVGGQSYKIAEISSVSTEEYEFQKPLWSPDGKKLLVTEQNKKEVYILTISDGKIESLSNKIIAGRSFKWLSNSKIVYSRHQQLETLSVGDSNSKTASADLFVYVDFAERKLFCYSYLTKKSWRISNKKANYYNPVISPDEKKVVVHIGSKMVIFSTDGSGQKTHLASGIAHSWNNESTEIFYFKDTSKDGYSISNSELYVIDIDKKKPVQLTFTPDKFEMWPAISADGSKIAFTDDRVGKVYVGEIKKLTP